MSVHNFEVDFVFPGNLIMEYNGIHHYKINFLKANPSSVSLWKENMLKKRGFYVLTIPFYEWEREMDEKAQKKYLINKIESYYVEKRNNEII